MLNFRTSRTLLTISAIYVVWCFGNPHRALVDGSEFHCQCVPPSSCADNRDRDVNGRGVLDIRKTHKNKCRNYFDVCCEKLLVDQRKQFGDASEVKCGTTRNRDLGPRILGGNSDTTQFGELPWMVLVWRHDEDADRMVFMCGGSLIHPQVVLTAAHCVSDVEEDVELKIRAGEWKVRTENEALPHQDIAVKEVVEHPRYEEGILWNDIALLFLTSGVHDADNIGFVCLPKARTKLSSIQSVDCLASGWGASSFKKASSTTYHSNALKKISLPIVPRRKCVAALRQTRLGKMFKLHKSFLCAGGGKNTDTCKGDGGGPLVCPVGEDGSQLRYVQYGIVSWGIGCGKGRTPGVYTNVVQFREWIDDQLLKRKLKTDYYQY